MIKSAFFLLVMIALVAGCTTDRGAVEDKPGEAAREEPKTIDLAPSDREMLLKEARNYQKNRDYGNALISVVRAERAEGDVALEDEVRRLKNDLLHMLHERCYIQREEKRGISFNHAPIT